MPAEKLRIIPLGGVHEIGKNMTVFEYGGDIMIVDCGLAFPDGDLFGIDLVIPDFTYLKKHKNRIRGLVFTHGHEDHIGAVVFLLREINIPIYCTPLTAGLIELKLEEAGLLKKAMIHRVMAGQEFDLGRFTVEFIHVNHSIPDSVALAIHSPLGTVIVTGDFKIDTTPVAGDIADLARLGHLGKRGVLALLADSTNVERPGFTMSERRVGETLDSLFKGCDSRIIVTTFASNVHRVQQIIDAAVKHGRKVAITGRSMENILRLSIQLGYTNIPPGTIVEMSHIGSVSPKKLAIITTGSQGEPNSGLYRMAFSGHRYVDIGAGDRVILSASPVPGNEKAISHMINEFFRKGADVIYERLADVHVSGHACQEELKLMLALTKPKYFMPVHGEYRHLIAHAMLAQNVGVPMSNIFIGDVGRALEFTEHGAKLGASVPAGRVLVDGNSVGDVGISILKDRKLLSTDGMLVVVLTLDADQQKIVAGPEFISRGFVHVKESDALMDDLKLEARVIVERCIERKITDWMSIKSALKEGLADILYKKTKCSPIIVPALMEV
jgi:ribonuclease J